MGRGGGPLAALLAGAAVAIVALVVPGRASAACAPEKPRQQLARADAAFVGRLIERRGDRLTFAVDQRVKGDLADRVEVDDRAPSSPNALRPAPGVQIGLFLRRAGGGRFVAGDCDVVTPEAMRAAAASGRETCERPEVLHVWVRRSRRDRLAVLLRTLVEDRDGQVSAVDVAWGDGAVDQVAVRPAAGHRRIVARRHRYPRGGRYRIEVVARSAPPVDCGPTDERSPARVRVIRIRPRSPARAR